MLRASRVAVAIGLGVALSGCVIPLATATGDRWLEPPGPDRKEAPLTALGARVRIVANAPNACAFLGRATGVGYSPDAKNPKDPTLRLPDDGDTRWLPRDVAVSDLRNVAGEGGATDVVIDAECTFSELGKYLVLYGRAYRCP